MTIIYSNIEEQENCLKREPYKRFTEAYRRIQDNIYDREICLDNLSGKEGFSNGFYTDEYIKNPSMRFAFFKLGAEESSVLIQTAFSFDFEDENQLSFHHRRLVAMKKRAPYFFLPLLSRLEFVYSIDDGKIILTFNSVCEKDKVLFACYSLISLFISIFALDD